MAKVLVVTSGKGGVGKTTTTAALGAALALRLDGGSRQQIGQTVEHRERGAGDRTRAVEGHVVEEAGLARGEHISRPQDIAELVARRGDFFCAHFANVEVGLERLHRRAALAQ